MQPPLAPPTSSGFSADGQATPSVEASLREIRDLRSALDEHAIVTIADPQGRITFANDKFCAISRFSREDLLGQDHRIVNSGMHPPEFFQDLWATISGGRVWKGEIRNRAKDGSFHWLDMTIVPFYDEREQLRQYVAIGTNISTRKEAEIASLRLAAIIESSDDAIVSKDLTGIVTSWNRGAEDIFGYSAAEMVGTSIRRLIPDDRQGEEDLILEKISRGEPIRHFETLRLTKSGRRIHVSVTVSPIKDRLDRVIGVSKIARDITSIKAREREVERVSRLYAVLSQINQAIVWMPDKMTLFQKICDVLVEFGKFRLAWIAWRDSPADHLAPAAQCGDENGFLHEIRPHLNGRSDQEAPVIKVCRENSPYLSADIPNDPVMAIWRDEALRSNFKSAAIFPLRIQGVAFGTLSVFAAEGDFFQDKEIALLEEAAGDISFGLNNFERETQRRLSTERYQMLFDHASDGIVISDSKGTIVEANPTFCRLIGYEAAELVGLSSTQIVEETEIRHIEPALETIKSTTDYQREWQFRCKNGTTFPAEVRAVTMPDGNVLAVIRDLTGRKQYEDDLRWRTAFFEAQVESAIDGILVVDRHGKRILQNARMTELWNIPPTIAADPDVARQIEFTASKTKDPVAFVSRISNLNANLDEIGRDTIELVHGTILDYFSSPVRDQAGHYYGRIWTFRDVTRERIREEKLAQALALEKDLSERARAGEQAKAEFLAVMSHEVRTPLNGILGFAGLLADMPHLPPESQEYVQTIRASGEALLRILDDVLVFSRIEVGRLPITHAHFSPRELLTEIRNLFAGEADQRNLRFDVSVDDAIPQFLVADADRIRQVLLNLVGNAIKFTETGSISLRLRRGPRNCCEFVVQDTGPGVAADQLERIFLPFTQADSSISRRHSGAGLGLSISRRLAELMEGRLTARSEPGFGAEFTLAIPLNEPVDGTSPEIARPQQFDATFADRHPLRILVVEDDRINLKVTFALLRRLGYDPIGAANGVEGVTVQEKERADCILMDLQMPEMDGIKATERIRAMEQNAPDQPPAFIAALTANVVPADRQRCFDAGMNDYMNKPVKMDALAALLAKAAALRS